MTSLPVAYIVHVAPGRLRLRVPMMRGNAAFFSDLAQLIERAKGAGNVHVNRATGSILIEGSSLSVQQFRDLARAQHWLDISAASLAEVEFAGAAPEHWLGHWPAQWKDEQWKEKSARELRRVTPFAILALALVQMGRGQILPPALSLLLYALDATRTRDSAMTRAAAIGS